MTGQQTLIARAALGLAAGAATLCIASLSRLRSLPTRRFDRILYAALAVSRLGLFSIIFLVRGVAPRGDIPAYYFDQAVRVLAHKLPYRDFESSYAPLHPYLDAGLIAIWHSPLAIVLFSVLVELLLLPLWMSLGRRFLAEQELRLAALLYLTSPVSLQFVTVDGQDNVVIAVLIAAAMLLLWRSRTLAAGAVFGTSVALVKFLPLLYAPAIFAAIPRRWRFVAGAVLVCGAVYGGFALLHTNVLQPLAAEGDLRSVGDLPYVVEAILGVTLPARLTDACMLLVLAAVFVRVGRAALRAPLDARLRALTFGMAAATLAFLLMSKKSWPPYLMLALFPVTLVVASGPRERSWRRIGAFALLGAVAVTEHSYWATILLQFSSLEFHGALAAGKPEAWALLAMESLLLAGYGWLLWEAMRQVRRVPVPELAAYPAIAGSAR
jgi:hypothetical protein